MNAIPEECLIEIGRLSRGLWTSELDMWLATAASDNPATNFPFQCPFIKPASNDVA